MYSVYQILFKVRYTRKKHRESVIHIDLVGVVISNFASKNPDIFIYLDSYAKEKET